MYTLVGVLRGNFAHDFDGRIFHLLAGLGLTTPLVGGITPLSTAKTALISAESPLAASLCPMFVFTCSCVRQCKVFERDVVNLLRQPRADPLLAFGCRSWLARQRALQVDHPQLYPFHGIRNNPSIEDRAHHHGDRRT